MKNQPASPVVNYVRTVKPYLPADAFKASPGKLYILLAHLVVVVSGYKLIQILPLIWSGLVSLIMGHSLACIAFLAHELSHNTIIRRQKPRYFLEIIFWCINLIPPTLWKQVHNKTHHVFAGTVKDPDRAFTRNERNWGTRLYSRFFYPNRQSWKWNPLVGFHFVPYILRNLIAAFYIGDGKPTVVPHKPIFTPKQRWQIVFELIVIIAWQISLFYFVEENWIKYLLAGPLSYLIASSIIMFYVFTNHFLNPLEDHSDPLTGTTSVVVPKLLNVLHSNFSYHTEHHLFPSMNSDHYEKVSQILKAEFGDRYNCLPVIDAWRKLVNNEEFLDSTDLNLKD